MILIKSPSIEKLKETMSALLECVKDKTIDAKERNKYYAEYLELSKNLLILSRV